MLVICINHISCLALFPPISSCDYFWPWTVLKFS